MIDVHKIPTPELKELILQKVRGKLALEAEKKATVKQYNDDIKKLATEIEEMLVEEYARVEDAKVHSIAVKEESKKSA
jgi:hypothetical protein